MRFGTLTPTSLLLLSAAVATAQPADSSFSGSFSLAGEDTARGPFESTLELTPDPNDPAGVHVVRTVRFEDPHQPRLRQAGAGTVANGTLTVTFREHLGARGNLDPDAVASAATLTVTVGPDGAIRAEARSQAGDSTATGRAPDAASEDDPSRLDRLVMKGKHLLAVGKDKVKERVRKERDELIYEDGVGVDPDFELSRYLHVGVGAEFVAIRDRDMTPGQAFTSRTHPDHAWIRSTVRGGVRVPLTTTIPVGDVTVGVGLHLAAKVDYEVTDLYPIPEGFSRDGLDTLIADVKKAGEHSFDLPLDSAEAQAMTVGAKRVFDGQGSVAVRGHLAIGHEVSDIDEVVRIGASARLGGFYRLQGDVRFTVERLLGDRVRLRVRRGEETERGANADLLLGAAVNRVELEDEMEPVVEYVDEALIDTTNMPDRIRDAIVDELHDGAADAITKTLRVRIKGSATKTLRDEVDISYVIDLANARAREAYDRGIRGDLTLAGELALDPDGGVQQEFRVLEVEERTHLGVDLDLSVLLEAGASRDVTVSNISVDDPRGVRGYEVFRFERRRYLSFMSWLPWNKKRYKNFKVEVLRRTVEDAPAEERVRSTLRFDLEIRDPHTFKSEGEEVRRVIDAWGLDAASLLPEPELRAFRSRYGETHLKVKVEIADEGLRALLASTPEQLFDAYVRAYEAVKGKTPLWSTEAGRDEIERGRRDNDTRDDYRQDAFHLSNAVDFVTTMGKLAAATTQQERAKSMKTLAKSAGFKHYVLAAVLDLTPPETVRLDASYLGDRVRIVDGREASLGTTVRVVDPR
jgi:hypothetical protein